MKHLIVLLAALLALAACSKEEAAPAPAEEPAAVEAEVPEAEAEATEEAVEETLEVVEESAAVEEESADEPIVLAQADTDDVTREWKFRENVHYKRLLPTQPTIGGADKIEVAELFMYSCPHCYTLDPKMTRWAADLDPAVRFVRLPVIFNRAAQVHAQLFFTAELLTNSGVLQDAQALHEAVFAEFHQRNNRLISKDSIGRLFSRFGVTATDFDKAWGSFYVNQKINTAMDLTRRYGIAAVPVVVVNGKYVVENRPELTDIIDELLIREGLR